MSLFLFLGLAAAIFGLGGGLLMSTCGSNGTVEADETRPFVLNCTENTGQGSSMSWSLNSFEFAKCPPTLSPCTVVSSDYDVTRTQADFSTVTVRQHHRSAITGTVECQAMWFPVWRVPLVLQPTWRTVSCDVRVIHPAQTVSNCRTEVDTSDWTVFGSCDVDKMYASDNHYTCLWTFPAGPAARTNGLLKLESFTESNLEYKRAACPFSGVPMPSADGFHDFRLTVNPGSGLLRGKSLEIRHPGAPTFLNCPEVIPEGDDVMCTCQPSASSPPAVVTWTNGEDFNAVLQLQNLKLTPNGTSFTCNQYWGGYSSEFQKRITYTIKVEMRSNGVSALIAEVVGSVVVIVLLIVVSVLIWIKRCNPWYAKPRRGGQEQDSHTYSDLDSRQEESTDHPAGGATGLYNEAFEQEPVPPRARNPNTEPQLPADYIELIESEISATEEEQDQQSAHYIELTETQSAASGVEPNRRPAKHVAIVSHPDPASLGTQCENTTCKKLLTATESETGMKCESTDRKELLASNETSPESQCDITICKEVLALAETSLETQCENTTCKAILAADECLFDSAATQECRDADGYEIPIQNDNSTVCE